MNEPSVFRPVRREAPGDSSVGLFRVFCALPALLLVVACGVFSDARRAHAHLQEARAALAERRFDGAIASGRVARSLEPSLTDAYVVTASGLWESGRSESCFEELSLAARVLRDPWELDRLALLRANLLGRTSRHREAREVLGKRLSNRAPAEVVEAAALLDVRLGEPERAIALVEQLDGRQGRTAATQLIHAVALAVARRFEEGATVLASVLAEHPDDVARVLPSLAEQVGREEVFFLLERCATRAPDDLAVRLLAAATALHVGDLERTQAHVTAVLEIDADQLDALRLQARLDALEGRVDAARAHLERALAVAPPKLRPPLWVEIAELALAGHDSRSAAEAYGFALDEDPVYLPALESLVLIRGEESGVTSDEIRRRWRAALKSADDVRLRRWLAARLRDTE